MAKKKKSPARKSKQAPKKTKKKAAAKPARAKQKAAPKARAAKKSKARGKTGTSNDVVYTDVRRTLTSKLFGRLLGTSS